MVSPISWFYFWLCTQFWYQWFWLLMFFWFTSPESVTKGVKFRIFISKTNNSFIPKPRVLKRSWMINYGSVLIYKTLNISKSGKLQFGKTSLCVKKVVCFLLIMAQSVPHSRQERCTWNLCQISECTMLSPTNKLLERNTPPTRWHLRLVLRLIADV